MRLCLLKGMMLVVIVLLPGCGGGDAPAVRSQAGIGGMAGQVATPAPSREPGESAPDTGLSAPAGGGTEAPRVEDRPELVYTRRYYAYRPARKGDPFEPLLTEGGEVEGLSLGALTLTGILWDEEESMIVLEDSRGRGYPLRIGDSLAGARLVAIRKDAAVFRVLEYGEVHSVVKELFVAEERPI
jgi:hypothetical protein